MRKLTISGKVYILGQEALKGQLTSEQIHGALNFPKMQRNIARISALASKMGQIKNVKAYYYPN